MPTLLLQLLLLKLDSMTLRLARLFNIRPRKVWPVFYSDAGEFVLTDVYGTFVLLDALEVGIRDVAASNQRVGCAGRTERPACPLERLHITQPARVREVFGGKIAMIGHGLGALVALLYTQRYSQWVDRFMAISMPNGQHSVNPRLYTATAPELVDWLLAGEWLQFEIEQRRRRDEIDRAIDELTALSEPEWPYLRLIKLLGDNVALEMEEGSLATSALDKAGIELLYDGQDGKGAGIRFKKASAE